MIDVRPVAGDDWTVVSWLWQAFRNDLSEIVGGLPRADGRYHHAVLDAYPGSPDHAGFLLWVEGEHGPAPVGFALVDGVRSGSRSIGGFWVVPAARRGGTGLALALDVIGRYPGPWTFAFQHDSTGAGEFWRRVARAAFGDDWVEERRPVPGKPHVPDDHWIVAPGAGLVSGSASA